MKKKRLTLIHTSGMMIPVFGDLCSQLLPKVEVVHMVDESLLKDIIQAAKTAMHRRKREEVRSKTEEGRSDRDKERGKR